MKLNRTLGLVLVATATLGAGAVIAAAAQTAATPAATDSAAAPVPGGHHWHHRGGGMLVGVMLRATRQLNLTSDQQTAIKGLLSNARAQHQAQAQGGGGIDMMTLANPGDPNYATALQNAKAAAAARLQGEVDLQSQIYNLLTPDQKSRLPQVLADMKSKMQARRAEWMQQHPAGAAAPSSN